MEEKRKRLASVGFRRIKYVFAEESRILALVIQKKRDVLICFRGTVINNFLNWSTDLQALTDPEEGLGEVHRGFKLALDSIWPQIVEITEPLKNHRFWLTGHSLGGALALLASARMQRLFLKGKSSGRQTVAGVYLFGAPRVGDENFKNAVQEMNLHRRIFAFANTDDVITVVPPSVKRVLSYCDTGQIALFSASGRLTFQTSLTEFKTFRHFLGGYLKNQLAASFSLEKLKSDWATYQRYFARAFAELKSLRDTPEKELGIWERLQNFFNRELPETEPENHSPAAPNGGCTENKDRKKLSQLIINLFTELFLEMNPYVVSTHDICTYRRNLQNNRDITPPAPDAALTEDAAENRDDTD